VRKLQIPYEPEAGFGALGPDGNVVLNETLLSRIGLTKEEVESQIEKSMGVIKKRNELFRAGTPFPSVEKKNVIIVDDGLASGYTMLSAVQHVRGQKPAKIIAAVPTGSRNTVEVLLSQVDELVCLNIRSGTMFAVADAYLHWYDLEDEEVLSLLRLHRR
jgi:putative phosphoribosyl transferase